MRILLRDLSPGTLYSLQIRANDGSGRPSEWSKVFTLATTSDTIAPATPANVVGIMTGTAFQISWDAVTLSSDGTPAYDLDRYEVKVESAGTGVNAVYALKDTKFLLELGMNRAIFTNPRANIKMSVRAVDKTGNASAYSSIIDQTNPAPANPANFSAVGVPDAIVLKWDAVADTDLIGYRIYSGTTAGSQTTLVWSGGATAATIASIAYGVNTWYKVAAVDVFGTESVTPPVAGPVSPKSPFAVDTTAPAVPTGLAATLANSANESYAIATVSWTAVADTDSDLSEYIIGYRPVGASDWQYVKVDYTNTSTKINGLLPYTNYDFRIRSSDYSANLSAWSSTVTATAAANAAPSTPSAPTAVSSLLRVQVTHDNTKAAGGAMEGDVAFYEVYGSTTTGFTPAATNQLGVMTVGPAIIETYMLPATGGTATQTWYIKVIAVDRGGLKSAASAQATATPGLIDSTNIVDATITNAKISDLAANKITAGTGFVNALSVKTTFTLGDASTDGSIQSFDYSGTTTGFKLAKSGLIINQGSIAAAALKIQSGSNLIPPEYAAFEFTPAFYTGKLTTGFQTSTIVTSGGKTGPQYLSVRTTTAAVQEVYLGIGLTDYNVQVEAGRTYIVSSWAKTGTVATAINFRVRYSDGTYSALNLAANLPASGVWQRVWTEFTVPAGVTAMVVVPYSSTATIGAGFDLDGIQVEEKIAANSTPSTWSMPGITSADGGIIRTGQIQSTSTTTVNSVVQPAWSINMSGNAQFGDALIRGKLLVGAAGADVDAGQSYISSGNFVAGSTGWKIDSSGNHEFNSGIYRGTLGANIVTANSLAAGAVTADKLSVVAGGGNRLKNSSFEYDSNNDGTCDGFLPYTFGTVTMSNPATGYNGGKAQRVTSSSAANATVGLYTQSNQIADWTPLQTYVITIKARADSAKAFGLRIAWNTFPTIINLANPNLTTSYQLYAWRIVWGASVEALQRSFIAGNGTLGIGEYIEFDEWSITEGDVLPQYSPNVTELLPGTVQATYLAAGAVTADKIALGVLGRNFIKDPSFEEEYELASTPDPNKWYIHAFAGAGTAASKSASLGRARSGMKGLYMKANSGSGTYIKGPIVAVVPGKTYNFSANVASTSNGGNGFYMRMAYGATTAMELADGIASYGLTAYQKPLDAGGTESSTILLGPNSTMVKYTAFEAVGIPLAPSSAFDVASYSVTTNVVTINTTDVHGFVAGDWITISGVLTGIDGLYQVATAPTTSSITVSITTPDQTLINSDGFVSKAYISLASTYPLKPDDFYTISASFVAPAGTNYFQPVFIAAPSTLMGEYVVDDVSLTESGFPATEVTAAGVRLFNEFGTEVGAFVSNRTASFSVSSGNKQVASISNDGAATFQTMQIIGKDSDGDGTPDVGLNIYGTEFKDWIWNTSWGTVAAFTHDNKSQAGITSRVSLGELSFTPIAGRRYRINVSGIHVASTVVDDRALVSLHATRDDSTPQVGSAILDSCVSPPLRTAGSVFTTPNIDFTQVFTAPITTNGASLSADWTPTGPLGLIRILLCLERYVGTGSISYNTQLGGAQFKPLRWEITDVGPDCGDIYWWHDGGSGGTASTVVSKKTYTSTWVANTSSTYKGSGVKRTDTTDMVQGYDPSGFNGNGEAIVFFGGANSKGSENNKTLSGATSGSTINKIEIYLYANSWYYNAGGTAKIGYYPGVATPGTYTGASPYITSANWPKPAGRWVNITSTAFGNAIKAGTATGVTIGSSSLGTNLAYYGRFSGAGAASNKPQLRITYTK